MEGLAHRYDSLAWAYDLLDWPFERFRYRALRPALVDGLAGHVLEAGVGTGRNLPYYPSWVRVTGIDLSRGQLSKAARRATGSACAVQLERADATALPFRDSSFDACLATFLFCVLPDPLQLPALLELSRVLRPGGLIRLLEYRYSRQPLRRLGQRLLSPLTEAIFGARFDRQTEEAIAQSGLLVEKKSSFLVTCFSSLTSGRPATKNGAPNPDRPQRRYPGR